MKEMLSGYYEPDESEIVGLWARSMIVLDTNALLNMYRVTPSSREQIQEILQKVAHRLWVPYQVSVEFHRNRRVVLKEEYDNAKGVAAQVGSAFNVFRQTLRTLQLEDRGCADISAEVVSACQEKVNALKKALTEAADGYLAPGAQDSILMFWTELLDGKVGPRPESQSELDDWATEAAGRYAVKMGPGYLDQEAKAGDRYFADGLVYERQYGDFVLWKQLLQHAKMAGIKSVILVTSDQKEDWWLDTKSVVGLRPQPELVMDAKRSGGIDNFWMYTLKDFVKEASSQLDVAVTEATLSDVAKADRTVYWDQLAAQLSKIIERTQTDRKDSAFSYYPFAMLKEVLDLDTFIAGDGYAAGFSNLEHKDHVRPFQHLFVDVTGWELDSVQERHARASRCLELVTEFFADAVILCDGSNYVWKINRSSVLQDLAQMISRSSPNFVSVMLAGFGGEKWRIAPLLEELHQFPQHHPK